jgi:hypothetical protein
MRVGYIPTKNSKKTPDELVTLWFQNRYEYTYPIKPTLLHGVINKNVLDPFRDYVLILYKMVAEGDIQVVGFMMYDEDIISGVPPKQHDPYIEHVPLKGFFIPWSYGNNDGVTCTLDDLCDRVDWILGRQDFLWDQNDMLDYTSCRILLRVGLFNLNFHKKQLEKEYNYFIKKIEPYTLSDASMQQLLKLNFIQLKYIESTLMDRQEYHKQYPLEIIEPKLWLSVHMTEIPTDMCNTKILYKGGYVHLHRHDIPQWIWRKLTMDLHNHPVPLYHKTLPEQLYVVLAHINENMKNPLKKHVKKMKTEDIVSDIEHAPPCINAIINGKKFPEDLNRQHFVSILKKGGITIEQVEGILETLNDKYPHRDGKISLKKRWDVSIYYNKGYSAPNCSKINFCPMNGNTVDQRKIQCYKLYEEKYKPPQSRMHTFFGPISWFFWNKKWKKI